MQVKRDGSLAIRPGLRYMSISQPAFDLGTDESVIHNPPMGVQNQVVGTHEAFYLNDGSKAYLFAVRENTGRVGFRVLGRDQIWHTEIVQPLDAPGVDFVVTGDITFDPGTTYVKYLQIDNKIFALSNNGEAMRYFTVGNSKTAKKLSSVIRPDWAVIDKLTVVHPDAAWIGTAGATTTRTNLMPNPNFERSLYGLLPGASTEAVRSGTQKQAGSWSLRLTSLPERTNLIHNPAHNSGTTAWHMGTGVTGLSASGTGIRGAWGPKTGAGRRYLDSDKFDAKPNVGYKVAYDRISTTNVDDASGSGGVLLRFYNESGARITDIVDLSNMGSGTRKTTGTITSPAGTDKMSIHPFVETGVPGGSGQFTIGDFVVCVSGESTVFFDGNSGTDYFWTSTAGNSSSVYHPPKNLTVAFGGNVDPGQLNVSYYVRAGTTVRNITLGLIAGGASVPGTPHADSNAAFTRFNETIVVPAGATSYLATLSIPLVPRNEYHYIDSILAELGSGTPGTYFDGDSTDTGTDTYSWLGTAGESNSKDLSFSVGGSIPPAETKTANTLISSTAASNIYNFGFFYTFATEIGESAPSQVTVVRAQRAWQQWRWETPNASGEPSGTGTNDGEKAADQLGAYMPQAVFDAAVAQGATMWHLYMFTWSDQDPVPVTAFRIGTKLLDPTKTYAANGWNRATPMMSDAAQAVAPIPTKPTRRNYTEPSPGGQGIVAADRMVLVFDRSNPAVIRWTSNQQGSYTDFTAGLGGGYKTLTSGNLQIAACVKLWQNPQSVDTLTILCVGTDGQSTGYYMAPAQVASQSEAVNIMAFEETTATPGTTSPYGVEVMNNALYHPLDEQLMKSVASNYNINHSSVTDQIQDVWRGLIHKEWIVSSQCDNRIYFLVYNPEGDPLEDQCKGNEVWVFDGQAKAGNWSRWKTQGVSLRKVEQGGRIGMSLVRPDGIYFFDDEYAQDDFVNPGLGGFIDQRNIAWKLETNTQGANRAHDAMCRLQQCNIEVGNFQGVMRYGIKGLDRHGKWRDISKLLYDNELGADFQYDRKDFLKLGIDIQEWFFYASSVEDENGVTEYSAGQFDLVQYRYTPLSVNEGYEWGSVETFEYGRAGNAIDQRTTDNGVPMPFIDTRRP